MSRVLAVLLAGAAFIATAAAAPPGDAPGRSHPGAQDQSQDGRVFRAAADAISVPVAVLDRNGRPVPDLPLDRFALFDNGVMQEISLMHVGRLPIDVTLVLDTSGSVSGEAMQALTGDIRTIVGALDPDDRVRLLTFSQGVRETTPLRPVSEGLDLGAIAPGGSTAFFNAVIAALLSEADPARPHLVVALGDGGDNTSWLREEDLHGVAERSDMVLHVVVRDRWTSTATCLGCRAGPGWLPYASPQFSDLTEDATAATGGGFHRVRGDAPLADVFGRIVEDFKATYLLWYEPEVTPAPGWHDLVIRIREGGGYEVRARRGYFGG